MQSLGIEYPLGLIGFDDKWKLCQTLWSWPSRLNHDQSEGCSESEFPSRRLKRFDRFFDHYQNLTTWYESDILLSQQALSSHTDIREIIEKLKLEPEVTRSRLAENVFAHRSNRGVPQVADQQRAINLAVKIMLMLNCSVKGPNVSASALDHGPGYSPAWRDDVAFAQYIGNTFPLPNGDAHFSSDTKVEVMARKLQKLAGLQFQPTDDLRNHLKLEQRTGIVYIFHHTAFLKEHLKLTINCPRNTSIIDALKRGALPRQLILEALDSIQKILFPLTDEKSCSLLRNLISTASFDPDCIQFESASIRAADERDIQYLYFGARLADLYEELQNPKPRGWVARWLERNSGARYVMLATLAGVGIAVVLGFLGLALSGFQAYIAYQQWKHPVQSA